MKFETRTTLLLSVIAIQIFIINSTQNFKTLLNKEQEELLQNLDKEPSYKISDVEQGPCNIPIEADPITQEEFLEKYAFKSPVVFRRSKADKDRNRLFKEKCELANLATEYGDKYVTVSSANTYSYKRYSMKLNDYLTKYIAPFDKERNQPKLAYGNETWYFFGENNLTEWNSLFELYERPNYNIPKHEHAYSFGIAAFYTGVCFILIYEQFTQVKT